MMYLPGIRITTFAMHRADAIVPEQSGLSIRACIIVPRKAFLRL
jgi:hypothetical protein